MTISNNYNDKNLADIYGFLNFVKAVSVSFIFFWHVDAIAFSSVIVESVNIFVGGGISMLVSETLGDKGLLWGAIRFVYSFGYQIVAMFFIASGFCLYLSFLKTRPKWKDFYIRRAIRIVPLAWIVLLAWNFVEYVIYGRGFPLMGVIYNLLFVQSFTDFSAYFGPFWFLGVLAQLYLLFPVLVWLFKSEKRMWIVITLSLVLHQAMSGFYVLFGVHLKHMFSSYLPMFLSGMLLAKCYYKDYNRNHSNTYTASGWPIAFAGAVLMVILAILIDSGVIVFSGSVEHLMFLALFFALLLPYKLFSVVKGFKRVSDFVSRSSYILFLTHVPIIHVVKFILEDHRNEVFNFHLKFTYPLFKDNMSNLILAIFVIVFIVNVLVAYIIQKGYDDIIAFLSIKRSI